MRGEQPVALEELEIDLLLEAIYRQHGFDFRGYARSSLRRRVRAVVAAESLTTVSGLMEKMLHDPTFYATRSREFPEWEAKLDALRARIVSLYARWESLEAIRAASESAEVRG